MNSIHRGVMSAAAVLASMLLLISCASERSGGTLIGEYLSGRVAARANALDVAARAYAGAIDGAPAESAMIREAVLLYVAAGDMENAAKFANRLTTATVDSTDGLAELVLVAYALHAGEYEGARIRLSTAAGAPVAEPVASLLDAWIEYGLSGPDKAIERLDAAPVSAYSGFYPLHRALLADMAGRVDEARAGFQLALLSLGGPVGFAAYGAFLEREADPETARAYYAALAKERSQSRRISRAGLARVEKGAPSQQFTQMTPAKGAAIAYYSFGAALIEQTAAQRALAEQAGFAVGEPRFNLPLAFAQMALYLDRDLAEARLLVSAILNLYGDHERALGMLEAIGPQSPYYEQARIDMAGALLSQEKSAAAITLLQRAIAQDRESVELRYTLAGVYSRDKKFEAAVTMLNEVMEARSDDDEAQDWRHFIMRAGALLELGRWEEAEADLIKAVEIAPEEPTTLNYLGYSWAERGLNLHEAFELIQKAIDLQPNNGAIVDSLGWAYYQLGEYDKAVIHLERAASLEPSDPTITDHLGDVYWRLGRKLEARYQWRHALEFEPTDRQRQTIEEKLKEGLPDLAAQEASE